MKPSRCLSVPYTVLGSPPVSADGSVANGSGKYILKISHAAIKPIRLPTITSSAVKLEGLAELIATYLCGVAVKPADNQSNGQIAYDTYIIL